MFIREAPPTENPNCLTDSGLYCSESKYESFIGKTEIHLDYNPSSPNIDNTFITGV